MQMLSFCHFLHYFDRFVFPCIASIFTSLLIGWCAWFFNMSGLVPDCLDNFTSRLPAIISYMCYLFINIQQTSLTI